MFQQNLRRGSFLASFFGILLIAGAMLVPVEISLKSEQGIKDLKPFINDSFIKLGPLSYFTYLEDLEIHDVEHLKSVRSVSQKTKPFVSGIHENAVQDTLAAEESEIVTLSDKSEHFRRFHIVGSHTIPLQKRDIERLRPKALAQVEAVGCFHGVSISMDRKTTTVSFDDLANSMSEISVSVQSSSFLSEDHVLAQKESSVRTTVDNCDIERAALALSGLAFIGSVSIYGDVKTQLVGAKEYVLGGTSMPIRKQKGLRGEGQVVVVSDSGFPVPTTVSNAGFPYKDNFLAYLKICNATSDSCGGKGRGLFQHGAHVTSTVVGNTLKFDFNHDGKLDDFSGIAADAKLKGMEMGKGTTDGAVFLRVTMFDDDENADTWEKAYAQVSSDSLPNSDGKKPNTGGRIFSNSWGGPPSDTASSMATQFRNYNDYNEGVDGFVARHPDATVTFAAGNRGSSHVQSLHMPGNSKNVITVAASVSPKMLETMCKTNKNFTSFCNKSVFADMWSTDSIAYFSSGGPTGSGRRRPTLAAVGQPIYAYAWDQTKNPPVSMSVQSGTSMATPVVSGAIALLSEHLVKTVPEFQTAYDQKNQAPRSDLITAILIASASRGKTTFEKLIGQNKTAPINRYEWHTKGGWGTMNLTAALAIVDRKAYGVFPAAFSSNDGDEPGFIGEKGWMKSTDKNTYHFEFKRLPMKEDEHRVDAGVVRFVLAFVDPELKQSLMPFITAKTNGYDMLNEIDLVVSYTYKGKKYVRIGNQLATKFDGETNKISERTSYDNNQVVTLFDVPNDADITFDVFVVLRHFRQSLPNGKLGFAIAALGTDHMGEPKREAMAFDEGTECIKNNTCLYEDGSGLSTDIPIWDAVSPLTIQLPPLACTDFQLAAALPNKGALVAFRQSAVRSNVFSCENEGLTPTSLDQPRIQLAFSDGAFVPVDVMDAADSGRLAYSQEKTSILHTKTTGAFLAWTNLKPRSVGRLCNLSAFHEEKVQFTSDADFVPPTPTEPVKPVGPDGFDTEDSNKTLLVTLLESLIVVTILIGVCIFVSYRRMKKNQATFSRRKENISISNYEDGLQSLPQLYV